jgi:hypothetical protein
LLEQLVWRQSNSITLIAQDRVQEVDTENLENLPMRATRRIHSAFDLHGNGMPGILPSRVAPASAKRTISPISEQPVKFTPLERVASKWTLAG